MKTAITLLLCILISMVVFLTWTALSYEAQFPPRSPRVYRTIKYRPICYQCHEGWR